MIKRSDLAKRLDESKDFITMKSQIKNLDAMISSDTNDIISHFISKFDLNKATDPDILVAYVIYELFFIWASDKFYSKYHDGGIFTEIEDSTQPGKMLSCEIETTEYTWNHQIIKIGFGTEHQIINGLSKFYGFDRIFEVSYSDESFMSEKFISWYNSPNRTMLTAPVTLNFRPVLGVLRPGATKLSTFETTISNGFNKSLVELYFNTYAIRG